VPLKHIDGAAPFEICNSNLSEYGVLGFELGYSLESARALVVWEAQFGDFANCAQCIIDQCISSAEAKWQQQTGLVMLLPHGLEGGGPEHSSARLERFLQLASDDERELPESIDLAQQAINLHVVNVTTPANYFHVLRRQLARPFRKPLVVMSPKSMLRHKLTWSQLADFLPGTRFHPVLPVDTGLPPDAEPRKLIFCSGKVYADLAAAVSSAGARDIAIFRLEQISPFPYFAVQAELSRFPIAQLVWCQEEPLNAGAWAYVRPRLETACRNASPERAVHAPLYAGRKPAAAPATGLTQQHEMEVAEFVARAIR
jgi:2-oxoglutarate dehydrogenase E1 component